MHFLNDFLGTYGADTLSILVMLVFAVGVLLLGAWVTIRDRKRGN